MIAVIQAGGKGTRLNKITKDLIPKPLAHVNGIPIIERQIINLKEQGILDFILIIGHLGHKIKSYLEDGKRLGVNISYVEEKEPLGSAGAMFFLKDKIEDINFIYLYGDVIFDIDINRMINFHIGKNGVATLFVHPNNHPFDSDLVILDEEDRVVRIDSKNNIRNYWYDNIVNAGFYIFNNKIFEQFAVLSKKDMEQDLIQEMIKDNQVFGYHSTEYIKDVGTIERLEQVEQHLRSGLIASKNLSKKQKCIFLDRDGTINKFNGLVYKEEQFLLEDHVIEAIGKINRSEYLAILITNQPVVARGLCDIPDVKHIHKKMATLLGEEGVFLDDIVFCPHHPDSGYPEENPDYKIKCACRKPGTEMIDKMVKKYNIDIENSFIIGDTTIDVKTGINANAKTILLNTGLAGNDKKYKVKPNYIEDNLLEAVNIILSSK